MEIREHIGVLSGALSGGRAYDCAAALSGFNRVPLSEGYGQAAEYCLKVLRRLGVDSRILHIPMEKGQFLWSQEGFDAWTCKRGTLRLRTPAEELLCDYQEEPASLIQRSAGASLQGVPILLLDRGSDPGAYGDLDLRGTVVFAPDAPFSDYRWATAERGALGILTDHIPPTFTRDRSLLPDGRSCFSFSWHRDETPCFGFVLTPRQGDRLRALCQSAPTPPLCDVEIETESAPGCAQVVEARIPGETEEEIVLTAHLCHPRPCANDNASGCAGAMEIMGTLAGLIRRGELPGPRRGLHLLLVPEVCGTFAYLASHEGEIGRMKAAVNLDMIGRRQEGRSGLLGIWATPDALPSFVIDLMAYVLSLSDREAPTFNIGGHTTPFHSRIMEYNGGSDHYVYCDPTVGVPCITLMQWMDSCYHTSCDTAEDLDPEMLHKSMSLAACWAFALASPDRLDLPRAFAHMRRRFLDTLHQAAERRAVPGIGYGELCAYETAVFQRAAGDALRLYGEEVRPAVERQKRDLALLAEMECPGCLSLPAPGPGRDIRVPRRNLRGPLSFVGSPLGEQAEREIAALERRCPGLYGYHSINHFILFWADGRRTVSQIARLVGLEGRYYSEEYVAGYLEILERRGVISFLS